MREARWSRRARRSLGKIARQPGVIHLAGGLAAALLDREARRPARRNRAPRAGRRASLQSGAERADDTRRDDRHAAVCSSCRVTRGIGHFSEGIASFYSA